jgi:hypothetical protein
METIPRPVEPIGYYAEADQTVWRLVRAICILGLVIGAIGVILVPLRWMSFRRASFGPASAYWWIYVNLAIYETLSVLLTIGSLLCLRRSPRARSWLLVYAYAYFAYAAWTICFNIWQSYSAPRGMIASRLPNEILSSLLGFSMGISFPIVVVILMAQREVRKMFAAGDY